MLHRDHPAFNAFPERFRNYFFLIHPGRLHSILLPASMKAVECEVFYSYDDTLARIIPERSLRYSNKKPLCPSSLRHPNAMRLFTCISEAVNYHTQAAMIKS